MLPGCHLYPLVLWLLVQLQYISLVDPQCHHVPPCVGLFWVCLLPVAKVFCPFRCLKISLCASYPLPKSVSSIRTAASRYSCHEWAINLPAKSDSQTVRRYIRTHAASGILIQFCLSARHKTLSAQCCEPITNNRHASGLCGRTGRGALELFCLFFCSHVLIVQLAMVLKAFSKH